MSGALIGCVVAWVLWFYRCAAARTISTHTAVPNADVESRVHTTSGHFSYRRCDNIRDVVVDPPLEYPRRVSPCDVERPYFLSCVPSLAALCELVLLALVVNLVCEKACWEKDREGLSAQTAGNVRAEKRRHCAAL